MMGTENVWKEKAGLLQRFLELTRRIADLLAGENTAERMNELGDMVDARSQLIEAVSRLHKTESAEAGPSDDEEKQKWLCSELLSQIQEMEEKNMEAMLLILKEYKERMRSNRQSRDTIGAYSRQMQEIALEGTVFNQTK
ncbi:hypothetical protein [Christensenella intestinihominis]|uniref:hypothetical protein n=1 Tax=Christensenella intestinihominis TaxID=1851429 RepID=UPI0011CC40CE|nr:hypothetical protein [Christensenella intestinihominis]